ncbi:MAG: penicillin-binding protein 2 [Actinobacteria bacterium]|nr:penicillin-binding protein 2 [Actinomycetota bacterium]
MVAVVFTVLALRVADVQTRSRDYFQALGEDQRQKSVTLAAERGGIFDRNGYDLALSLDRQTIFADPRFIEHPAEYAAAIAPLVGVDEVELRVKLSQPRSAFAYIARKVEPDVAAAVRALDLIGIGFVPESKRYYPAGELAAPVLGFVGLDNEGLSGLEQALEGTLAGRPGELSVERDPTGTDLPGTERTVKAARRGVDLVLTIDRSIQYEAERALVEQVEAIDAKGGMAIVMDVTTGDILAMVTVDGETDERGAQPAPSAQRNRPVTDVFEPGSTNKVVTVAAAIEAGLVTPDTRFVVPQAIKVDGQKFEDVEAHGTDLTVADILRESSNVGTILIARTLGSARFDAALRNFGFGRTTGLDFPGEAPGILLPLSQYNDTSLASMPVGNGLAVTALQMLDVYVTLANDGVARQPRLVAATIDSDGERLDLPLGTTRQVVSASTAAQMRQMLAAVVEGGTGTKAQVPGYTVGGKTGTARKPPYETPPYRYVASFVGFAPVENPRLAAIVVLDEPAKQFFGGTVAAPVFSRIMQQALAVERVPGAAGTLTLLP